MKKLFFLTCLMLSMITLAQETKRVAILETVDKQGNVSYANKLILRANLAKAITNTPGYEAYDRTDLDAIIGEQDFQRTGLVSNDQIKRLGEMTGAKYVLVAEAALVDAHNIFITAKLLDVETAKVEFTDNMTMGVDATSMQQGCNQLVKRLISTASSTMEKFNIERIGSNSYMYKGGNMDNKEFLNFLKKNCPIAYKEYQTGQQIVVAGYSIVGVGAAVLGIGIGLCFAGPNETIIGSRLLFTGVGIAVASSSILLPIGYVKRNNAYKTYNESCASTAINLSFNFTINQNGLGIAMAF